MCSWAGYGRRRSAAAAAAASQVEGGLSHTRAPLAGLSPGLPPAGACAVERVPPGCRVSAQYERGGEIRSGAHAREHRCTRRAETERPGVGGVARASPRLAASLVASTARACSRTSTPAGWRRGHACDAMGASTRAWEWDQWNLGVPT